MIKLKTMTLTLLLAAAPATFANNIDTATDGINTFCLRGSFWQTFS